MHNTNYQQFIYPSVEKKSSKMKFYYRLQAFFFAEAIFSNGRPKRIVFLSFMAVKDRPSKFKYGAKPPKN